MERITFRLPEEMLDKLDDVVEESDEFDNRSQAVREAVETFVDDQDWQATDEEIAEKFGSSNDDSEMLADGGTAVASVFNSRMVQCEDYPHDCSFMAAKSTTNFGVRRWTSFDRLLGTNRCPECGGEVVHVDV
ncbi:hypothetical protein C441_04544 [Haloferax sulfurifontis ATCC BAA-897]|nr:hypothetical protein C441_04544 [Haloferax sulfurifontis ATCC BAA-897]